MSKKTTEVIAKFAALNALAIYDKVSVKTNYEMFMNNYEAFLQILNDGIDIDSDFEEMKDILKQEEIEAIR